MDEPPERDEEMRVRADGSGALRLCRANRRGWTAKRRGIFLDHFAATCNATASARAAGMPVRGAFALRQRDPQFAAEWDEALATGQARLAGKLIVYAETRGDTPASGGPDDELVGFDPDAAGRAMAMNKASAAGRKRHGGPRPRIATREEVETAVLKLLARIEKRIGARA